MVNQSLTDPFAFNTVELNGTGSLSNSIYDEDIYSMYILSIFTILTCIFGFVGNGMVIWLLGFHIKRNPFTTYVLNLAIADFCFLMAAIIDRINYTLLQLTLFILFDCIYSFMFSTSQCLLTVISMDRCVSEFFPLWHHCHHPTNLSSIVCVIIWLLSFLPPAIGFILEIAQVQISYYIIMYQFLVNSCLCFPLMTISSLMLFIKICCKSKQQRRWKLLITILVTIFFFLFLCFPLNTFHLFFSLSENEFIFMYPVWFCACLNSSVNPLIYYLVGKPKKGRSSKSMKARLQIFFKEEEI